MEHWRRYMSLAFRMRIWKSIPDMNTNYSMSTQKQGTGDDSGAEAEIIGALRWRHNGRDGVSNHQPHDCLLNRLFRRISKKISEPRVTGLCAGNSPLTGEFPITKGQWRGNVSIWWRHHGRRSIPGHIMAWLLGFSGQYRSWYWWYYKMGDDLLQIFYMFLLNVEKLHCKKDFAS